MLPQLLGPGCPFGRHWATRGKITLSMRISTAHPTNSRAGTCTLLPSHARMGSLTRLHSAPAPSLTESVSKPPAKETAR